MTHAESLRLQGEQCGPGDAQRAARGRAGTGNCRGCGCAHPVYCGQPAPGASKLPLNLLLDRRSTVVLLLPAPATGVSGKPPAQNAASVRCNN